MAMYANGNESPTLRTYVSDETKVSFLNVSTFKSAQVPWTYFFSSTSTDCKEESGENAVSAADVALFGLNIIIPLMNAEILKVRMVMPTK